MGLLDDAIREHLELKRRRGADPDEVAREEREVLGARQRAESEPAAADEAPAALEVEEPEPFDPEATREEPVASEATREESAAAPFDAEADRDEPTAAPFDAEEATDEAEPARDEAATPAPGYEEDPWLEEERDEVPAEESLDKPEGEDVLEETPDFLQETPEHDRLWFEQRPPRDFDWDK